MAVKSVRRCNAMAKKAGRCDEKRQRVYEKREAQSRRNKEKKRDDGCLDERQSICCCACPTPSLSGHSHTSQEKGSEGAWVTAVAGFRGGDVESVWSFCHCDKNRKFRIHLPVSLHTRQLRNMGGAAITRQPRMHHPPPSLPCGLDVEYWYLFARRYLTSTLSVALQTQ